MQTLRRSQIHAESGPGRIGDHDNGTGQYFPRVSKVLPHQEAWYSRLVGTLYVVSPTSYNGTV